MESIVSSIDGIIVEKLELRNNLVSPKKIEKLEFKKKLCKKIGTFVELGKYIVSLNILKKIHIHQICRSYTNLRFPSYKNQSFQLSP